MRKRIWFLVLIGLSGMVFTQSDFCQQVKAAYNAETASINSHYNMACCAALDLDRDSAFKFLRLAVDAGYRDLDWMQSDTDLLSLYKDFRWTVILSMVKKNLDAYLTQINAELYSLYREDQADRGGDSIDWELVSERDEQRRTRVDEILEADSLKHSDDYFHAAMVFQHGFTPEHYKKAQNLALKSVEINPANASAKWLSCAAEDRYLHSMDLPQVWGTQYRRDDGYSPWTMEPFDRKAKTDD